MNAATETPVWQQYGHLSGLADCFHPDTDNGKQFLENVAYSWLNESDQWDDPEDAVLEIAESAVPAYTYQVFEVFADLGAWQWDDRVKELGHERDSIENQARIALVLLAEDLIHALKNEGEES